MNACQQVRPEQNINKYISYNTETFVWCFDMTNLDNTFSIIQTNKKFQLHNLLAARYY